MASIYISTYTIKLTKQEGRLLLRCIQSLDRTCTVKYVFNGSELASFEYLKERLINELLKVGSDDFEDDVTSLEINCFTKTLKNIEAILLTIDRKMRESKDRYFVEERKLIPTLIHEVRAISTDVL